MGGIRRIRHIFTAGKEIRVGLKFSGQAADLFHVAISAGTKQLSVDDVREALAGLVRSFEADAAGRRKQIKDLLDSDPEIFSAAAVSVLSLPGESRGTQHLVALLAGNGMLLRALCDLEISRDEAIALARAARRSDPFLEVALARSLADCAVGGQVNGEAASRLLDVLAEIADAGRIVPSLMRLMRHPDSGLRSKAVRMIGRGSHSAKWVMGRLSDSDPRVRANAIESLWAVDIPEARTLLNFAANDAHPQVVGNSLLGLYYLGDSGVLLEIVKLANHESADFRACAAWLMGESGDPRFSDALRRMIADSDAGVRKRALASLAQLKAANSTLPVGDAWHLGGRVIEGETSRGLKRLMLGVASDELREQQKVVPLQFLLSEGNQHVLNYKVSEKTLPEAMSVVFVIPRSRDAAGGAFVRAVLDCLRWKRPADPWSILPYIEAGASEAPPPRDPEPPVFTTNGDFLAASMRETPKKLDCTDLWTGVWRAIKPEGGQSRGKRHVIVLCSTEETRSPGHGLFTQMGSTRMSMQVISAGPNQQLEEFCGLTNTPLRSGADENIVEMVHQAYLNLMARYEIAWQPVGSGGFPLKVRVQAPMGWAEALIPQGPARTSDA
jgi:HEAT repeat protein